MSEALYMAYLQKARRVIYTFKSLQYTKKYAYFNGNNQWRIEIFAE